MSTQHTPEPWYVSTYREKNILDSKGYGIVKEIHCARRKDGEEEANARRIVACVNACAGMPDGELLAAEITGGISAMLDRYRVSLALVEQMHDELQDKFVALLAAAKEVDRLTPDDSTTDWNVALIGLSKAIAKARGQDKRCGSCDGTGDVHRADGEWIGTCTCDSGNAKAVKS